MRRLAILGGLGYLGIFISGIYANFFVLEALKVAGNDLETFQNFSRDPRQLLYAFTAFVAMVVFDLTLTWVLYRLFSDTQAKLSRITAWLRVINVVFFAAALVYLNSAMGLVFRYSEENDWAVQELGRALEGFNQIWLIGLVFFGFHLVLLSALLKRSKRIAKIVPLFLFIAGIGYVADSALQFSYTNYAQIAEVSTFVVVLPGIIGELALTGWLLFRAGKKSRKIRKRESVAV